MSSFAYRYSPVWAQELFISAKSSLRGIMRESRTFQAIAAQIDVSQWWSERELRDFQSWKLRAIVGAAVHDVPHYRDIYRSLPLDFEDREFSRLFPALPVISKADVREGGKSFISEARRGPLFPGSTSGTTGAPLGLFQDLGAINRENVFIRR